MGLLFVITNINAYSHHDKWQVYKYYLNGALWYIITMIGFYNHFVMVSVSLLFVITMIGLHSHMTDDQIVNTDTERHHLK